MGVGGFKSLGLLGGATGWGARAFIRRIPRYFFPGGGVGGGDGNGQATKRELKRAANEKH